MVTPGGRRQLERPGVRTIQAEADPRRVIEQWLVTSRAIVDRIGPLMRVLRGAVSTDVEVAAQWKTNQDQTRAAYGFLVGLLVERGALRDGLGAEQARDVAFVISNVEAYLQHTDVCGWTADEWQQRTAALLAGALLPPAA